MKPPDKVKEAATYVAPLVDEFLQSIKPWAQVKNYATTPSRTMSTTIKPPSERKNSKKKQQNTSSDFEAQAYKSHPRRRSCLSKTAAQKRHRRHQIRGHKEECQP